MKANRIKRTSGGSRLQQSRKGSNNVTPQRQTKAHPWSKGGHFCEHGHCICSVVLHKGWW